MAKRKRMRLPNGFGQISELKGRNLRKPFRAMVTVSKDENGKPITKLLKPQAYFETYNDAYTALLEYHRRPYDLNQTITVEDLYHKWYESHTKDTSDSTKRSIKAAWGYCESIYNISLVEVRPRHIRHCIEHGKKIVDGVEKEPGSSLRRRIKSNFNQMFDYAIEYGYLEQNYARMVKELPSKKVYKESENPHIAFTNDEIDTLWKNVNEYSLVKIILIQCYSGWRPQELGRLEVQDVDLTNGTFKGGMKTKAGIERVVPIHSKIKEFVKEKYDEAVRIKSPYLLNIKIVRTGKYEDLSSYSRYHYFFKKTMDALGLYNKHRPHDPRKHFVTMAKSAGVNEYAIKYIVGHVIEDLTERVYTERDVKWLKEEIEKIK